MHKGAYVSRTVSILCASCGSKYSCSKGGLWSGFASALSSFAAGRPSRTSPARLGSRLRFFDLRSIGAEKKLANGGLRVGRAIVGPGTRVGMRCAAGSSRFGARCGKERGGLERKWVEARAGNRSVTSCKGRFLTRIRCCEASMWLWRVDIVVGRCELQWKVVVSSALARRATRRSCKGLTWVVLAVVGSGGGLCRVALSVVGWTLSETRGRDG